jgi:hypothetical protein
MVPFLQFFLPKFFMWWPSVKTSYKSITFHPPWFGYSIWRRAQNREAAFKALPTRLHFFSWNKNSQRLVLEPLYLYSDPDTRGKGTRNDIKLWFFIKIFKLDTWNEEQYSFNFLTSSFIPSISNISTIPYIQNILFSVFF